MGAQNVLVSLAEKGAVFINKNGVEFECSAPKGIVINSTGAGDSMVAGFIGGYCENKDLLYAFKKSIACGSATAFSQSLASKDKIEETFAKMQNKI